MVYGNCKLSFTLKFCFSIIYLKRDVIKYYPFQDATQDANVPIFWTYIVLFDIGIIISNYILNDVKLELCFYAAAFII